MIVETSHTVDTTNELDRREILIVSSKLIVAFLRNGSVLATYAASTLKFTTKTSPSKFKFSNYIQRKVKQKFWHPNRPGKMYS